MIMKSDALLTRDEPTSRSHVPAIKSCAFVQNAHQACKYNDTARARSRAMQSHGKNNWPCQIESRRIYKDHDITSETIAHTRLNADLRAARFAPHAFTFANCCYFLSALGERGATRNTQHNQTRAR